MAIQRFEERMCGKIPGYSPNRFRVSRKIKILKKILDYEFKFNGHPFQ